MCRFLLVKIPRIENFGFLLVKMILDGTPVKDKLVCQLCLSEVSYCKEHNKSSCAFGTTCTPSKQIHTIVKIGGRQGQTFETITVNATKGFRTK